MNSSNRAIKDARALRARALEIAKEQKPPKEISNLSPDDTAGMLHELRVHQIELEIQNEELRRAQAELEASRARYIDLYDFAPIGYFTVSELGLLMDVNLSAAILLGVARSELLNQPITRFIVREDQDIYYHFRRLLFTSGEPQECELRLRSPNGKTIWVHLSAIVMQDLEGVRQGRVAVLDIAEQKALEDQLFHARKMEAIGTLAGGVAHDFNNILSGILAGLSLIEMDVGENPERWADVQTVKALVARGAHLSKQLLGFARRGKYVAKPLDLTRVVSATSLVFGSAHRHITIEQEFAPDLYTVYMDESQLEQVLLNLFLNASHAMSGGGRLILRAENVTLTEREAAVHQVEAGRFVKFVVEDTGIGMDSATKARLFEPFFSIKALGHGTGLGLASVYGIIKNHNGIITVESEFGKGTAFTLYLPTTAEKPAAPKTVVAPASHRGGGLILIVDDEEKLLNLYARALRSMGYEVLTAQGGQEALELVRSHKDELSLVILDLVMPQMSGAKTFEALHELAPDLKVLLASGYSADGQAQELLDHGCSGFIQKPFDLTALSEKIRSMV